jgi:ubiquinone/menaquinone biosynthesis C-methylase UbiE
MVFWTKIWDEQHRQPTGLLGRYIGEKMVRQHHPETAWTISLLDVQSDHHVLEIGFGAGRAIEMLAPRLTEGLVEGIDLSATMVAQARRRNREAIATGQVRLREGNILSLPFADQQFDRIFSIHTVYFWPSITQALCEVQRVLKPGGLLAITFSPGKVGESVGFGELAEAQLIPVMVESGFVKVTAQEGPASRQYRSAVVVGVR